MKFDKHFYPDEKSIADVNEGMKWIPKSLLTFLNTFIDSKVKQNSLGQCLVYAARPKSAIIPVPLGLAVKIDHVFSLRWNTSHLYDLASVHLQIVIYTRTNRMGMKKEGETSIPISTDKPIAPGYSNLLDAP